MQTAAALIVAAIGFLVCLFGAIAAVATKRPGWAFFLASACLAFAWVFALEWNEHKRLRISQRHVLERIPDFPPQRKHPIR